MSETDASRASAPTVLAAVDFRPGKLVQTGSPYDLALAGPGFFAFQDDDGVRFSRAGRLTPRSDGRLVDAAGGVLQAAGGGDVIVEGDRFEIGPDGRFVSGAARAGAVGIWDTSVPEHLVRVEGGFADPETGMVSASKVEVVQGHYEASNVSTADEMVQMIQALRLAEAGQRVMIAYDDIMGRVITSFGEAVQ